MIHLAFCTLSPLLSCALDLSAYTYHHHHHISIKSLGHELLEERRGEALVGRLRQWYVAGRGKVLGGVEVAGLDDGQPPAVLQRKGGIGLRIGGCVRVRVGMCCVCSSIRSFVRLFVCLFVCL